MSECHHHLSLIQVISNNGCVNTNWHQHHCDQLLSVQWHQSWQWPDVWGHQHMSWSCHQLNIVCNCFWSVWFLFKWVKHWHLIDIELVTKSCWYAIWESERRDTLIPCDHAPVPCHVSSSHQWSFETGTVDCEVQWETCYKYLPAK